MASKISGVGVHTIRAWEKRYKALEPIRDASGHRTYTKSDVEKLMLLSELCLLGYTISKVAKLSIPDLKLLLIDLGKTEESVESHEFSLVKEKPTLDASLSMPLLLFALKSYKLDVIHQELSKLKSLISSRDLAIKVILPLARSLYELIKLGEFNRVQSETVTMLIRFHSGHDLYRYSERKETNTFNISLATIDGDSNDLNSIMAGLLCQYYGFNFTFIGSGLSFESISESIKIFSTNFLILSTSELSKNISHVQQFVEKIMNKFPSVDILLNGNEDLDLSRIPSKHFSSFKTIEALDDYLASKN